MGQTINIHTRFQHRRATSVRWAEVNPILREGELGLETDTRRIKFGDGFTAWNDLAYSTRELLPAGATQLGGIKAGQRGKEYTVEVLIDPQTQRLYAPAYPVIPELAAVAKSGQYSDLENTPAPYQLPAASENTIGGVSAAPKTTDYTVEVKKDPASHKLYVPPSTNINIDDGKLPAIAIRVIYNHQSQSTHFTNEIGPILNAKIYFRPLCDLEYFNQIMPDLYFGLARCSSRRRQRRTIATSVSSRSTQWHIVGEPAQSFTPEERYPLMSEFSSGFNLFPIWTYENVKPVAISDLINEYTGEWIELPYDLETIVRRFIYIGQKDETVSPETFRVLPIQTLGTSSTLQGGFIKISGNRLKTWLTKMRTKASEFYASVNLGFCICRKENLPPNVQRWCFGPVEKKRAMVVAKRIPNTIHYYLKDPVKRQLIR